jgi:hypothetical protein
LLNIYTVRFHKMFRLKHKSPYPTDFYLLIQLENKIKVYGCQNLLGRSICLLLIEI